MIDTNVKDLRIEAVYGRGTAISYYKVVDTYGNVIFWGDYCDCYLYIHPEQPRTIFDRFQE